MGREKRKKPTSRLTKKKNIMMMPSIENSLFARLKHDGLITAEGHEVTIPNLRALKLYADAGGWGLPPMN